MPRLGAEDRPADRDGDCRTRRRGSGKARQGERYEHVMMLAPFPSRDAFKLLEPNRVRYAIFHMHWYNLENTRDVLMRLKEFEPYLRPIYIDADTRLCEIVGFPP